MDYEKKYKDALERAKLIRLQLFDIGEEANEIEHIFPELTESEDEKIKKELIDLLNVLWRHYNFPYDRNKYEEFLAWLEKQNEQKSVWNEEDEYQINTILHGLDLKRELYKKEGNKTEEDRYNTQYNWLKSFKPQNHWKPSEEQMNAFEHFVRSIGESGYASPYDNNTQLIYSLLNDLKKL